METKWPADSKGSEQEWGLDEDGKICETTDKRCRRMLVVKGGFIPLSVAVEHGLATAAPPALPPEPLPLKRPTDLRTSKGKRK